MHPNELLTQNPVHRIDVSCVGPKGIMNGGEREAEFIAPSGRKYHVRRIERVNEVGRKCLELLALIDDITSMWLLDIESLQAGNNRMSFGISVWLYNRQLHGSGPNDCGPEF